MDDPRRNAVTEDALPFLTVVMPVRNEADRIAESLGSVLNQDYPSDRYEVIVADGMSTDQTRERVSQLAVGRNVRIIDNPRHIAPTGLNAAIRASRGTIIVRVDGHCEVGRDYLTNCVALLHEFQCDGVGGPIDTIGDSMVAQCIAVAMSSPFGVGGSSFRTLHDQTRWADTVPFPAYRRELFDKIGLYDEELVRDQDDEFNARIRKASGRLLLSPRLRSRYFSRASLGSLRRQYYQYGYWKVRVLQKHPRQMSVRHFVPACFVASVVALGIAAVAADPARLGLLFAVAAYGVASCAAAVLTARRRGWRYLPLLPLLFATLHASYGCGFLMGLWSFRRRWSDRQGQTPRLASTVA